MYTNSLDINAKYKKSKKKFVGKKNKKPFEEIKYNTFGDKKKKKVSFKK